ncbi:hypothetical protein WA158_006029 [Blastocystis sp. Blastoise]
MSSKYPEIYAIWDLDGTLLDTEGISTTVMEIVLEKIIPGQSKISTDLRKTFYGLPTYEWVRLLLKGMNCEHLISVEDYAEQYEELMLQMSLDSPYMPGALRITEFLRKNGVKQAVATSSRRDLLNGKASHHPELFEKFEVLVSTSDEGVVHGKPAPDIFLKAAELLSAPPNQCIVFEDSVSGMQAGLSAGMRVIAIPGNDIDISNLHGLTQIHI